MSTTIDSRMFDVVSTEPKVPPPATPVPSLEEWVAWVKSVRAYLQKPQPLRETPFTRAEYVAEHAKHEQLPGMDLIAVARERGVIRRGIRRRFKMEDVLLVPGEPRHDIWRVRPEPMATEIPLYRIPLELDGKPVCPECGAMGLFMGCRTIPDGATTIVTDFTWADRNNHTWPANFPDQAVPNEVLDRLSFEASVVIPPSQGVPDAQA